jgi:hypothetical protein
MVLRREKTLPAFAIDGQASTFELDGVQIDLKTKRNNPEVGFALVQLNANPSNNTPKDKIKRLPAPRTGQQEKK